MLVGVACKCAFHHFQYLHSTVSFSLLEFPWCFKGYWKSAMISDQRPSHLQLTLLV